MRLLALLICELLAAKNGHFGGRRRIQRKNGPGKISKKKLKISILSRNGNFGYKQRYFLIKHHIFPVKNLMKFFENFKGSWALTAGKARANPNLSSVNNLNGVGCQLIEVEDEFTMAIGGFYLKRFTNCGRCARVTCSGNACPTDKATGKPMSVVARIITQTTTMDDDKDVELNVPAWTALMGARAALPAMSVSWAFDSCPEPEDGRKKIYIHEDTNDKKEFLRILLRGPYISRHRLDW